MKKIILFGILITLISSCNAFKSKDFKISGKMENAAGRKVMFSELEVRKIMPVDSATIDDEGKFSFERKAKEKGFYIISFGGERVILVTGPGEKVKISGDISLPASTYEIKGSDDSELLQDFFRRSSVNVKKADSVRGILKSHEGMEDFAEIGKQTDALLSVIIEDQKKLQEEFIAAHPKSPAVLLVINFTLGPIPVFNEERDTEIYIRSDSILYSLYPENTHVQYHHMRVDAIKGILKMRNELPAVEKK